MTKSSPTLVQRYSSMNLVIEERQSAGLDDLVLRCLRIELDSEVELESLSPGPSLDPVLTHFLVVVQPALVIIHISVLKTKVPEH